MTTNYKSGTAKNAIIEHLAKEFPLSTKRLHHILEREYALNVTYQAIHKALQELEKEHIVTKMKEGWQLNNEWLQKQERFIQGTKQKYSGNKNKYNIDLTSDNPQVFHFDNHTDFSVETAKLISNKVLNQNKATSYMILEYGYWTIKFHFDHLIILAELMISSPRSIHIIRKRTPFGAWMQKQYERVGALGVIGSDVPFEDDFITQGEWLIQIHFSDESKKIIEKYWKKWKTIEDTFKDFGLKEEPKMEIQATVTKNPALARFMREQIVKYYEIAKKQ